MPRFLNVKLPTNNWYLIYHMDGIFLARLTDIFTQSAFCNVYTGKHRPTWMLHWWFEGTNRFLVYFLPLYFCYFLALYLLAPATPLSTRTFSWFLLTSAIARRQVDPSLREREIVAWFPQRGPTALLSSGNLLPSENPAAKLQAPTLYFALARKQVHSSKHQWTAFTAVKIIYLTDRGDTKRDHSFKCILSETKHAGER